MAELKPYKGHYYLWQYIPNKAAAVIFLILFLLGTAAITFRMFQTRTWFTCVFVIGGLCTSFSLFTVLAGWTAN
jgi:hypothetical protein